jgi:hypothetical protein
MIEGEPPFKAENKKELYNNIIQVTESPFHQEKVRKKYLSITNLLWN